MSLKAAVAEISRADGTSINQFIATAVAEKVSARRLLRRQGGQPPDPQDRLES